MFLKKYISFLVYICIVLFSTYLSPLGTDYYEINQLFNCLNNPDFCPLEISIYNYSYGLRFLLKYSYWAASLTLIQISIITYTFWQLNILSKKQKLNNIFIITAFFSTFLKDYYLNAFAQAIALTIFIASLNIKKNKYILLVMSTITHISSIIYFFIYINLGRFKFVIYLIIFINLSLFILNTNTLFTYFTSILGYLEFGVFSKIIYYVEHQSVNEGKLPLLVKSIFFIFALNTEYIKLSKYKSVYLLTFLLYSSFLTIDVLANRILALGKIFEILAFASLFNKPLKKGGLILSLVYVIVLFSINFL